MKRESIQIRRIQRWRGGIKQSVDDQLAVEEPMEIRINNQPVSVTMRTPGHDKELVAGFLFSENVVRTKKAITRIDVHPRNEHGNIVNISLTEDQSVNWDQLRRSFASTSSCGLCGRESIEAVRRKIAKIRSTIRFTSTLIESLPGKLLKSQSAFSSTGGLHAAALFDLRGRLLVAREDIGRHNAVDKVIGWGLLHGKLPFDRRVMLVSGRASFEIVQKCLMARLPVLCAISAPSSLAVDLSKSGGQTLIGFLRETQMNIYSAPRRIVKS
jgi:FdhD protein